ncbi:hypothetical protein F350042L8_34710 [Fusobacterium ulcerans]|uniref:Uncharacterized protein n=1 Tax=Fusobacterium ulcerans 12-1B TaxID=457404 RepID=H1PYJ2_9FUSO|nr:hypothetical protein [Fusobacterium ulcerans]EHO77181.1 hypothetical protein HMPREF0402_03485 [Fusobacterium ulcerans 12-1B]
MLIEFLNFYFSTGEFFTKALFFFVLIYGIIILFKAFIGEDDKKSISRFPIIILIILVIGSFGTSSFSKVEDGYTYKVLKIEYPSPVFRIAGERDIYYSLEDKKQVFKDKEDIKKIRIENNSKLSEEEIGRLLKELENLKFEEQNINNFLNEILECEIKTQINIYIKNLTDDEIKEVRKEIKSFNFNEENTEDLVLILRLYKEKLKEKLKEK